MSIYLIWANWSRSFCLGNSKIFLLIFLLLMDLLFVQMILSISVLICTSTCCSSVWPLVSASSCSYTSCSSRWPLVSAFCCHWSCSCCWSPKFCPQPPSSSRSSLRKLKTQLELIELCRIRKLNQKNIEIKITNNYLLHVGTFIVQTKKGRRHFFWRRP